MAYAKLHITSGADAAGAVAHAEVYIQNDVTGKTFGRNTTFDVPTNGGWADSTPSYPVTSTHNSNSSILRSERFSGKRLRLRRSDFRV